MTWPLPALLAWAASWSACAACLALGVAPGGSLAAGALLGLGFALRASTPWRRVFVAIGFPLSWFAGGFGRALRDVGAGAADGSWPAWLWLVPLALLWLAYPRKAWRDAPLFPTPTDALQGLSSAVPLAPGASILDAGCGLGAGLIELRRAYPDARLFGIEWSWPLRWACAWRCRDAHVSQGDIWNASWARYDLVYLFQRPESLAGAMRKASAEMRAGSWLASLEFEAIGWQAERRLDGASGRPVWLYRVPFNGATQLPDETP
ncbi:MAG: class I SAM-dependent methyltransferase [Caldimonas sp.]